MGSTLRDQIVGFEAGIDVIDLSLLDGDSTDAYADRFNFIGTAVFDNIAGQLRFINGINTILQGDVNGDGLADFEVQLNATATISVNDIVL